MLGVMFKNLTALVLVARVVLVAVCYAMVVVVFVVVVHIFY